MLLLRRPESEKSTHSLIKHPAEDFPIQVPPKFSRLSLADTPMNPFNPSSFADPKKASLLWPNPAIRNSMFDKSLTHVPRPLTLSSLPPSSYSKGDLDREVQSFVLEHFQQEITPRKKEKISLAWYRYKTSPNAEDLVVLKKLNIPRVKQDAFYQTLVTKYGWSESSGFSERTVRQLFTNRKDCFHAKTFAQSIELEKLLSLPPSAHSVAEPGADKSGKPCKRDFDHAFFPSSLARLQPTGVMKLASDDHPDPAVEDKKENITASPGL
jgi:hypothetical protein